MKLTTATYTATIMATIVSASPHLGKSVMTETAPAAENTSKVSLALAEGDIDCQGSAFCELLGSSCDEAYRKVIPSNTYSTFNDGTCGLFVSGGNCAVMGQDLIDAYNDIREIGHCTHCGRKEIAAGCMIKIDRVTGC
ncbi:hypothetical protein BJX61DRAFT_537945 [Aspergillus egyptiacus]|nr:hypothetical protein BJX61DRAFT_537945 [Aspergillus egyptiacus]